MGRPALTAPKLLSNHSFDHVRSEVDKRVVVLLKLVDESRDFTGSALAAAHLVPLLLRDAGRKRGYGSVAHVCVLSVVSGVDDAGVGAGNGGLGREPDIRPRAELEGIRDAA